MPNASDVKAGEAFIPISLDMSGIDRQLKQVQSKLKAAGAKMRDAGRSMMKVGGAMGAAFGLAAKEASSYADEVSSLARVTSRYDAEQIGSAMRELSTQMPVARSELMRLAETAGSLGISGVGNIQNFVEVAAMMGETTRVSAAESGQALAKLSNAMNVPIEQAENMGSVIAGLAKENAAWGDEIVAANLKAASSAGMLEMSFQDLSGITATLISEGMNASRAGTLLNTTLMRLAGESKKVAETLGLPVDQFQQLIDDSPTDALRVVGRELQNIESRSKRMEVAKEIFGIRSSKVLNKFVGSLEDVNRNIGISNDLFDEGSELERQYAEVSQDLSDQVTKLWNRMRELGVVIGNKILPSITRIVNALKPAIQGITSFAESHGQLVKILAATGGVLAAAGAAIYGIGVAAQFASGSAMAAAVSVGALTAKLAIIGGALAIVADWLGIVETGAHEWAQSFQVAGTSIASYMDGIVADLRAGWNRLVAYLEVAWLKLTSLIQTSYLKAMSFVIDTMSGFIQKAIDGVNRLIGALNKIPWLDLDIGEIQLSADDIVKGFDNAAKNIASETEESIGKVWDEHDKKNKQIYEQYRAILAKRNKRQAEAKATTEESQKKQKEQVDEEQKMSDAMAKFQNAMDTGFSLESITGVEGGLGGLIQKGLKGAKAGLDFLTTPQDTTPTGPRAVTAGTFGAQNIDQMFGGKSLQEKQLSAQEKTAKHTKRMSRSKESDTYGA